MTLSGEKTPQHSGRKGTKQSVLWLSSFLENQQARVRFNRSISRSRKILEQNVRDVGQTQHKPIRKPTNHSKVGSGHQENSTNIAQVRTEMYADDVFILAKASSLTQAQKALQNMVSAVDNWE